MKINQNYINHIALVLDASGSMSGLRNEVIKVADAQIAHLAQRSRELDQETRITVYTFDDVVQCLFYDKDVLRMPSLAGLYRPDATTALIDASLKAIEDLAKTPELYGDHAFLVYVLTDGAENASVHSPSMLESKLQQLRDNWTVAVFVPNQAGKFEAKKFGFPADNIAVWDTSSAGFAEVGRQIRTATDNFMQARTTGVRGSRNLFSLDVNKLDKRTVASNLDKLHPGQYRLLDVRDFPQAIAPFVEAATRRAYKLGEAFYQLTKTEEIQPQKAIALYDMKSHAVYSGAAARQMLGLPDYKIKVAAASHPDFKIFVQSTSVNRKLLPGTQVLLLS